MTKKPMDIKTRLTSYYARVQEKFELQKRVNQQLADMGYSFLRVQDNLYGMDSDVYLVAEYNGGYVTVPLNEHSVALVYQGLPAEQLNSVLSDYSEHIRVNGLLPNKQFYEDDSKTKPYSHLVRDEIDKLPIQTMKTIFTLGDTYTTETLYNALNEKRFWGFPKFSDLPNSARRGLGHLFRQHLYFKNLFVISKETRGNPSKRNEYIFTNGVDKLDNPKIVESLVKKLKSTVSS